MEKINVAELLRNCNCPKGMELDCTMFDNVTFARVDYSRKQFPIEIVVDGRHSKYLTKEGCYHDNTLLPGAKCVIFPKGKTTWEGFHRPFEDGDIVAFDTEKGAQLFIFKEYIHDHYYAKSAKCYMMLDCGGEIDFECGDYYVERLATEEEKEKLFKVIKYNGYVWNEETKSLEKLPKIKVNDRVKKKSIDDVDAVKIAKIIQSIHTFTNKFDITTLKPFQKVLVRDSAEKYWGINLFGFYNEITKQFHCMGNTNIGWDECIPYEGNEHLLGTTNDCDEYFKNW